MKTGEEFWRDTLGEGLLFAGAERCRPRGCAGWQKGGNQTIQSQFYAVQKNISLTRRLAVWMETIIESNSALCHECKTKCVSPPGTVFK